MCVFQIHIQFNCARTYITQRKTYPQSPLYIKTFYLKKNPSYRRSSPISYFQNLPFDCCQNSIPPFPINPTNCCKLLDSLPRQWRTSNTTPFLTSIFLSYHSQSARVADAVRRIEFPSQFILKFNHPACMVVKTETDPCFPPAYISKHSFVHALHCYTLLV